MLPPALGLLDCSLLGKLVGNWEESRSSMERLTWQGLRSLDGSDVMEQATLVVGC